MVRVGRRRFPARFSPVIYGIVQAGLTTAIASAVATFHETGWAGRFLPEWFANWVIAWSVMLPVVILVSPFIKRAVEAMVDAE